MSLLELLDLVQGDWGFLPVIAGLFVLCFLADLIRKMQRPR